MQPSASSSAGSASSDLLTELQNSAKTRHVAEVVTRILETGDPALREAAAQRVVLIATFVGSREWRDSKRADLHEADSRAGISPTEQQFERQLDHFQTATLAQMYRSLGALGGDAAMDYAFAEASNSTVPRERRLLALDLAENLARSGAKRHAAEIPALSVEVHQAE